MSECLICQNYYEPFISFGKMPIANGFLNPDQYGKEYFFELKAGFCPNCNMVQLVKQPDREMMFHEEYAFFSSTSARMTLHFKKFADLVAENLKSPDPFVVEIGSNDGIMLQNFAKAGIRHLGIEPSANVAREAINKGIQTISEFFDEKLAKKIVDEHGQADAVLAANVMCHIPYLHSVAAGIKILLKPDGVFMFEDPYLGDIVEKVSYDQIYDEHAFYFSVASVRYLFEQHELEVTDVMPQNVHGGSMRYVISHKGSREISPAVVKQREKEQQLALHLPATFEQLHNNIESSRNELIELLNNLRKQGKRIVGYGATSKSTTVNNYCGIGPDLVEFISDTTPIKQGKYTPGAHIPVRPYQDFSDNYPDYALLFAWNHAEEIMAKEQKFMESGGKWIVYVPKVQVLA
ncbi:MAG: class I SAM-dependent methyltransferase [Desulfobacterales bacterium]|nr:class I SAM-dependent methyltransferase [Desulfobacterales bacterium]